ncbi:helix-turn-helix domain-containing protein [Vagococcus xieshaowenii]|uniref:Mga helix-turn-helix domain-containing protein n=1 Tax=Vagococcus xieshaowenii TaxID=2562451 RepID=A0AAJ5EFN8_9ENTE|nr:helix-turn-helix domain-containing protein [Vagococcus xieshaowenii]QCA28413.1 hypothetical protein E4Z98_03465 [Vagococcus xieshaowenii]TFZ42831.1 hypothetical protein E4031_02275 [Vagococcus xieshaowenii]
MRELLGDKDNRRLQVIEAIYLNPGMSIEQIADKLTLTSMQVQIDIGFLNKPLTPLEIEVTKDKKCFLHIPQHLSSKVIYQVFLEHNLNFKLLEAILYKEYEHYEELANELFISQATLKRTISFVNGCFKPHGISIKSRPVRIEGNEANIRAFYLFYLQERYPDDQYPFEERIQIFSKDLVNLFIEKFPSDMFNYASKTRMKRYVAVSLLRETKHHEFEHEAIPKDLEDLVEDEINRYVNKEKFEYIFKMPLTPQLYQGLFLQYINYRHAFSIRDYRERISLVSENHEIFEGIKQTVEAISQQFDITLSNKDSLLIRLYNVMSIGAHLTITPYVIYPNRKIFLLFSQSLKATILDTSKALFNQYIPMVAGQNEAYFYEFLYLLVTHWPNFYQKITNQVSPCHVGLFFNSDVEHMYYTKANLEFIFGKKINVTIIESDSLEELSEKSNRVDLLIINFILPELIKLEVPYVSVVDGLGENENRQILHLIDTIYYDNMYNK